MKALFVFKDLQPNRPDKATYLANHKKTGLWSWTQLSASPRTILFRWKSFLDHVDHAARRAPRRWTTARPRKGTRRSRGRRDSGSPHGEEYEGSLVWLRCEATVAQDLASGGNSRGDEASTAAQPATGGRSMRHDRRWFGRLEQEDQRLKKHYGRWMDIVRSLQLESFILTKLTKPSVRVNLVGPQVSLPPRWGPASRGSIHFCVRNTDALPVGLS